MVNDYSFYLTEDIPATGLYIYTPVAGERNRYREQVIGVREQLTEVIAQDKAGKITAENICVQQCSTCKCADYMNVNATCSWLQIGDEDIYLGFLPQSLIKSDHINIITNGYNVSYNKFILLEHILTQVLPCIAAFWHNRIYGALANDDKYYSIFDSKRYSIKFSEPFQQLYKNAQIFWKSIAIVSREFIECLSDSLTGPVSFDSYELFNAPALAFHLHRIIMQGFCCGHKYYFRDNYIINDFFEKYTIYFDFIEVNENLDIKENSSLAWERVLKRAANANKQTPIPKLLYDPMLDLNMLNEIDNIWGKTRAKYWRPTCRSIYDYSTPGKTDMEEWAFWYLHYPHWWIDLRSALDKYKTHGAMDKNLEAIAGIISSNLYTFFQIPSIYTKTDYQQTESNADDIAKYALWLINDITKDFINNILHYQLNGYKEKIHPQYQV